MSDILLSEQFETHDETEKTEKEEKKEESEEKTEKEEKTEEEGETTEEGEEKTEVLTKSGITLLLQSLATQPLAPITQTKDMPTKLNSDETLQKLPPDITTIQKRPPVVIIEPATTEQVTTLITGKKVVPKQLTSLVVIKPVIIQPTPETLDSLLVKRSTETDDIFNMRSTYSRVAMKVFSGKINPATAVLIGEMATNKALYGIKYPDESDRVINYINGEISK